MYIHRTLTPLRPAEIGRLGNKLNKLMRRREVKAMPGCCGTTEKQEPNTEQKEQKAEEKENPRASSCEVGQCCS